MDAVIKLGGSLAENPSALKSLCVKLSRIAKKYSIIVVPGGGRFADVVRDLDAKFELTSVFSHNMAILAMDQYGLFLSQLIPNVALCDSIEDAERWSRNGKVVLFLPSKLLFNDVPFEPSWDVTSDSITAYIAKKSDSKKIVLVTTVDGIFNKDPRLNQEAELLSKVSVDSLLKQDKRTSVDRYLPIYLQKNNLNCFVVNGLYPSRINDLLKGKKTICTEIIICAESRKE